MQEEYTTVMCIIHVLLVLNTCIKINHSTYKLISINHRPGEISVLHIEQAAGRVEGSYGF